MQIQVSDAASQWFRDELALQSGDAVRFFWQSVWSNGRA